MTKFGLARSGVSSDSGTIDAALAGVIAEASMKTQPPVDDGCDGRTHGRGTETAPVAELNCGSHSPARSSP